MRGYSFLFLSLCLVFLGGFLGNISGTKAFSEEGKQKQLPNTNTGSSQENSRMLQASLERLERKLVQSNLDTLILKKIASGEMSLGKMEESYRRLEARDPRIELSLASFLWLRDHISQKDLGPQSSYYFAYGHILSKIGNDPKIINPENLIQNKKQSQETFGNLSKEISFKEFQNTDTSIKNLALAYLKIEKAPDLHPDNHRSLQALGKTYGYSKNSKVYQVTKWIYGSYIYGERQIMLPYQLSHQKQIYNLSCEANSMKLLFHSVQIEKGQTLSSEKEIIDEMILDEMRPRFEKNMLHWSDPREVFVGDIRGKQSSQRGVLSGYGIYAPALIRIYQPFFESHGYRLTEYQIDESIILHSLKNKKPVLIYYILSNGKPLTWKLPNGEMFQGYVGEHTAVIIGAGRGPEGNLDTIFYYEGRSTELQSEKWESFRKKAEVFNSLLVIEKRD